MRFVMETTELSNREIQKISWRRLAFNNFDCIVELVEWQRETKTKELGEKYKILSYFSTHCFRWTYEKVQFHKWFEARTSRVRKLCLKISETGRFDLFSSCELKILLTRKPEKHFNIGSIDFSPLQFGFPLLLPQTNPHLSKNNSEDPETGLRISLISSIKCVWTATITKKGKLNLIWMIYPSVKLGYQPQLM